MDRTENAGSIAKNDEFNLTIEDMSTDGAGIGRRNGFVWFVKDAVTGDVVTVRATKVGKSYGFARLMKIITPSRQRTEPKCPVSKQCGGCQLQMMDYHAQLRMKENMVKNDLIRIGGIPEEELNMKPILGMEEPWRYRNKAQFPIGRDRDGRIIAGFYAARSHRIVECRDCLLGVTENKKILDIILGFMEEQGIEPYDEERHQGLVRHVLIRKGFSSGELMVCIVIPLLFFVVYMVLDGFLSLVDPTYGQALISGGINVYSELIEGISTLGAESPIVFTPSSFIFPTIISLFCNFLYFHLCGICFKKNKLVGAIAILFGLSLVLSLLTGIFVPRIFTNIDFNNMDDMQIARWVTGCMNAGVIISCVLTVGLGWGVWRRIKTIQH